MRLPAWVENGFRLLPRHLIAAFFTAAILFILGFVGVVDLRERNAYDFRLRLRPSEPASRAVQLVLIDDRSLQAMGAWPWRRKVHAELIRILKAAEVKTVFFDVLFPEKSQYPDDDRDFAAAIQEAGNVVLPFHFISGNPPTLLFPLPEFLQGVRQTGYANTEPDDDGVVRAVLPSREIGGQRYYHSAFATFFASFQNSSDREEWIKREFSKNLFGRRMLVNYPGKIEMFPRFSAGELFEKAKTAEGREYLRKIFNGKIVMFGDVSTGTSDISTTPIQPVVPGIFIQASVLNALIKGLFLTEASPLFNFLVAFALAWLVAWIGQKLRPQWSFAATIGLMAGYVAVNFLVFYYGRMVFYLPTPLAVMFTVFVLSLFFKYMDVRIESDFLERELHMASKIQQSLLPASQLKLTELEAGFRCLFFEQVGGDLYDWIELGDGRVALCLGDVSGKGVPAALYMSRALNELRHQVRSSSLPGEILSKLNHSLVQGETSGMFLTLFFMILDFKAKKIRFSNAGHDPMVFFKAKTAKAELITDAGGLPIGIMDDQDFETGEIDFDSGDGFLITSDGIKEQKSPKGELYGSERLQQCVEKFGFKLGADALIDEVMADVVRFANGRSPHDDRTLVCAKII